MKLGFVNLPQILAQSDRVKKRRRALEQLAENHSKKAADLRAEITGKSDALNSSESAHHRQEALTTISKLRRNLQRYEEDATAELENMNRKLLQELTKELDPLLQTMAKEKELTAVLTVPNPVVAYIDEQADFTAELIEKFDQSK